MSAPCDTLAIIPARGGSKRIPRKNIRDFRGRPMLVRSIEVALASDAFDTVMVSTDNHEIAELAQTAGAEVPFMRSAETSDNHATTSAVLLEVLEGYARSGRHPSLACCLYATAPMVTAADLLHGRDRLLDGEADVMMPVTAFSYPIWRSLRRDRHGRIALNFPDHLNARSQDLPAAYHDAAQWYWFRTTAFLREQVLMGPNTGSVVLPGWRVQDIDTEEDWIEAERKHEQLVGWE